ncbi:MAG: YihY/virulence factor BrkB family protein [Acidobacteriaceae bacterium]
MSFGRLSIVPQCPTQSPKETGSAQHPAQNQQGKPQNNVRERGLEGNSDQPTAPDRSAPPGAPSVDPQAGEEELEQTLRAGPAVPVANSGTFQQVVALLRYMTRTEVHTYAFSVAAQSILSLFPFIVLLLTLAQRVFHSTRMVDVVVQMMSNFLPSNQYFVMRNMRLLAFAHTQTRILSVVMLLVTSTGVFLPLEVALNSVWGVRTNRNYLHNQIVSLALACGVGLLAMASVALSTAQQSVLAFLFFGHVNNFVFAFLADSFLRICALLASIGLFFLIYWVLPNRKVPARAVLPTAVVMGILWEIAKYLYVLALPRLDLPSAYGPFSVSVGLILWAFLSGLLLLAGAYVTATRQALREARQADREREQAAL